MRRALATLAAAAALVIIPATDAHADTYGWKWTQPTVYVYDGTSAGSQTKVAEAVTEWRKGGAPLAMTSDPARADILVIEEWSGYGGTAEWTSDAAGQLDFCRITVDPFDSKRGIAEHIALHELGHCIGLAHNAVDRRGSVMNRTVGYYDFETRPSAYDLREVKSLYGR